MLATPEIESFLAQLHLESGPHAPDSTFCVMEAVAFVAGEPWSDSPECASPVLSRLFQGFNDGMGDDDRQLLKPYIRRLLDTRASLEVEVTRAYAAADWAIRVSTPRALRLAGLEAEASDLEALPAIQDEATADTARWAAVTASWAAASASSAAETARSAAATASWAAETASSAAVTASWAADTASSAAATARRAAGTASSAADTASWAAETASRAAGTASSAADTASSAAATARRAAATASWKQSLEVVERLLAIA